MLTVKTIDARKRFLRDKGLCSVCLKHYHGKNCSEKCGLCSGMHHRSICQGQRTIPVSSTLLQAHAFTQDDVNVSKAPNYARLMTTDITLKNPHNNRSVTVTAFFDTGSSVTLVSDKTVRELGISPEGEHRLRITGVGDNEIPAKTYPRVSIQAEGEDGKYSFKALVMENDVCGKVKSGPLNENDRHAMSSLFPSFVEQETENRSFTPQILFGIGDCQKFVKEQHDLPSGYKVNNSVFGPIVSGGSMFNDDVNEDDYGKETDVINEQINQQLMCCFALPAEKMNGDSRWFDPRNNDDAKMIMHDFSENQYIMGLFSHTSDPPDISFI